ncbi:MAG: hypothetical protein NTW74_18120, partial [Acidobacteria bacterium]|nr:hypothetical protein [Acidobacteriota bacterium]
MTPCSEMHQTPLVILATVLKDSGEGWGTQNAEIRVDKVLKGTINAGTSLTVNSMAGTSCYFRLVQGKQYVLFANPAE